jgi:hypothetical protein
MYKNWKQICKIGEKDWCLMMALAHAEPESPVGRRLKKAFPKCFSTKKESGPIPLSVLKDYAERNPENYEGDSAKCVLAQLAMEPQENPAFPIPYIRFSLTEENATEYPALPLLPNEINKNARIGDTVQFKNEAYVVVEHACREICLAPAQCIHIDIEPYEGIGFSW